MNINIHTVCEHWIFASQASLVMGVMSYRKRIVEETKRQELSCSSAILCVYDFLQVPYLH